MFDLKADGWKSYRKRPNVTKKIYKGVIGELIKTLEGFQEITEKQPYIQIGLVGEASPISAKKISQMYTLNGKELTEEEVVEHLEGTYSGRKQEFQVKADSTIVWAKQIPLDEKSMIETAWGDKLFANEVMAGSEDYRGTGDYAVASDDNMKPNLSDVWVVKGKIFDLTYEEA